MKLKERVKSHAMEYAAEYGKQREQHGERKTKEQMLDLMDKGYTLEQIRDFLLRETPAHETATRSS
jgi:hypothetical protein